MSNAHWRRLLLTVGIFLLVGAGWLECARRLPGVKGAFQPILTLEPNWERLTVAGLPSQRQVSPRLLEVDQAGNLYLCISMGDPRQPVYRGARLEQQGTFLVPRDDWELSSHKPVGMLAEDGDLVVAAFSHPRDEFMLLWPLRKEQIIVTCPTQRYSSNPDPESTVIWLKEANVDQPMGMLCRGSMSQQLHFGEVWFFRAEADATALEVQALGMPQGLGTLSGEVQGNDVEVLLSDYYQPGVRQIARVPGDGSPVQGFVSQGMTSLPARISSQGPYERTYHRGKLALHVYAEHAKYWKLGGIRIQQPNTRNQAIVSFHWRKGHQFTKHHHQSIASFLLGKQYTEPSLFDGPGESVLVSTIGRYQHPADGPTHLFVAWLSPVMEHSQGVLLPLPEQYLWSNTNHQAPKIMLRQLADGSLMVVLLEVQGRHGIVIYTTTLSPWWE